MNLSDYFAEDRARRRQLAQRLGTSADYLWQLATGWNGRKASPELARRIETATDGRVSCSDLRPDIWPPEPPATAALAEERGAA